MGTQGMQKSEYIRKQYLLNFKRNGQICIIKEKEKNQMKEEHREWIS